jgi:histidinol-phosphate phosphatase family protein
LLNRTNETLKDAGNRQIHHAAAARYAVRDAPSRLMGIMESRAILLDRDGTLIEDPGYLSDPASLVWKEGAFAALARLQASGFVLIIVTNQSGIARGFFTPQAMERVHARIRHDLTAAGVRLAAIYHCPHGPDDGCDCRKPETGLVLQAAREHGLDLSRSWMVGDKCSDILAGQRSRMRTALVYSQAQCTPGPDVKAATLEEAAETILAWK